MLVVTSRRAVTLPLHTIFIIPFVYFPIMPSLCANSCERFNRQHHLTVSKFTLQFHNPLGREPRLLHQTFAVIMGQLAIYCFTLMNINVFTNDAGKCISISARDSIASFFFAPETDGGGRRPGKSELNTWIISNYELGPRAFRVLYTKVYCRGKCS